MITIKLLVTGRRCQQRPAEGIPRRNDGGVPVKYAKPRHASSARMLERTSSLYFSAVHRAMRPIHYSP